MRVAKRFGENLRRLRKGADISQEELGLRCSLHRTEIGLLERGARVPRVDTLIKIAAGLGVRIDCALLDGISWTPPTTYEGGFKVKSGIEQDAQEARDELEERTALWEENDEG
jgi:transcriptional regulator with XRE-family HTH domain